MAILGNMRGWLYVAFGWTDAEPVAGGVKCEQEQQRMAERRSKLQQLRTETAKLKIPSKDLNELESRVRAAKNNWAEVTEDHKE